MKTISVSDISGWLWAMFAAFVMALVGCAHAEPLPGLAPRTLHWLPVANANSYGIYYLTNTAPDFSAGTNSQSFTHYLPDRNDTNAVIGGIPDGSLIVVVAFNNSTVSGYSAPVTNPPTPIMLTIKGVFIQ